MDQRKNGTSQLPRMITRTRPRSSVVSAGAARVKEKKRKQKANERPRPNVTIPSVASLMAVVSEQRGGTNASIMLGTVGHMD